MKKWFLLVAAGLLAGQLHAVAESLQQIIDRAEEGDIIYLAEGVYTGGATLKDNMSIVGAGADLTIIDGYGTNAVLTAGRNALVMGVTLRNGKTGIQNNGRCFGLFESILVNTKKAVAIQHGSAVLGYNMIEGAAGSIGVESVAANPYLVGNLIRGHQVGFRGWHHYNPTLYKNYFVSNTLAIQVGPDVDLATDANVFWKNKKMISGSTLSETDVEAPVDAATLDLFPGASPEQYQHLMALVFEDRLATHPVVLYDLTLEEGLFGMGILSPWASFHVASSTLDTKVRSYLAYDLKTDRDLNVTLVTQERPLLQLDNADIDEKEEDRFALDTLFDHPASLSMNDRGELVFKRLTNLARIEIYVPEGYLPVSINHEAGYEWLDGRMVVKITDAGHTDIELKMGLLEAGSGLALPEQP